MDKQQMEELLANGNKYHVLLAKFMTEHPEVKDILQAEEDYLAYTMLRTADRNMMFGMMLDLPGMMESYRESMSACFMQGYYRCYQKLQLDKM